MHSQVSYFWLLLKLLILALFLGPFIQSALGLEELRNLYSAPQALAMGDAMTADAEGYLSNYYNPAGLAKVRRKDREIVPISLETFGSALAYSEAISSGSFGTYRLFGALQKNIDKLLYFRFNAIPAVSIRGFAFSLLTAYEYAAQSDGANADMDTVLDIAPSVGFAKKFANNLLSIGVTVRGVFRNQLKGNFPIASLSSDQAIASLAKEGWAVGGDIGLLITVPYRWLPTLGLVWKDVLDTDFNRLKFLNTHASGIPDPIRQSVNGAFSLHPYLSRHWKATLAAEVKHLDQPGLSWRRRTHLGLQLEDDRMFYLWLGLNQFYLTAGMALRLPGGNLEFGSYGVEIGSPNQDRQDRRFFLRYTVSL